MSKSGSSSKKLRQKRRRALEDQATKKVRKSLLVIEERSSQMQQSGRFLMRVVAWLVQNADKVSEQHKTTKGHVLVPYDDLASEIQCEMDHVEEKTTSFIRIAVPPLTPTIEEAERKELDHLVGALAMASRAVSHETVRAWTKEQRVEALAWCDAHTGDGAGYSGAVPPTPPHVAQLLIVTVEEENPK